MERYICIHGHFYQPPRENAWIEEVELQESAYPYHDWNDRITAECYAPNSASRIFGPEGRIIDIINNYSKISFNFGPTLLFWIKRHEPELYSAILLADRLSMEKFSGHGSAIAQAFNHLIMPLANRRDKVTQVKWGITDFESRFKRPPEGMWLPETAVDLETLDIMAGLGIKFTVLSPRQASEIRKAGEDEWMDVSGSRIDPTRPYLCELPSGGNISLFFYDGPISQAVAFRGLLASGEIFSNRLRSAFLDERDWPQIVHIATDGETYGHHHPHGDMALSYCLHLIEMKNHAKLTNYGEYLEKHPPEWEVRIFENSSWSCIHGIERWRSNCGCNTGMHPDWNQEWRMPLRTALDNLRAKLTKIFEGDAPKYLKDPWAARDDYINVLLKRDPKNLDAFIERNRSRSLSGSETPSVLKLLEMERHAMQMYTSCGWFFDEISGIETVQVMQYAARAMQLAQELTGISPEREFISDLEKAPSNLFENGAGAYLKHVKPSIVDWQRLCAHFAISSLFRDYPPEAKIYCFDARTEIRNRTEAGRMKLLTGISTIHSEVTAEERTMSYAMLHMGDQNVSGGVRFFINKDNFEEMSDEINSAFAGGSIPDIIRLMDKFFGMNNYSLWHLFRDEQKKILDDILQPTYDAIEGTYRQIYDNNYNLIMFIKGLGIPIPRPILSAAEYIINTDLKDSFRDDEIDRARLRTISGDIRKLGIRIDTTTIEFIGKKWVSELFRKLGENPTDLELFRRTYDSLALLKSLPVNLDLWKAQNIYFSLGKRFYNPMLERVVREDQAAREWMELYNKLGFILGVKVAL